MEDRQTEPFVVPDMTGEPIKAWRAWRMKIEMVEHSVLGEVYPYGEAPAIPPVHTTVRQPTIMLTSVNQGFTWEPRKVMTGVCKSEVSPFKDNPHDNSETPKEGCSCGIHALDSPLFLAKTSYVSMIGPGKEDYVWGEIAMWGKIIQGETGLKAQYAYPTELLLHQFAKLRYMEGGKEVVLERDQVRDMLEAQYGVPVSVSRTILRPDKNTDEVVLKLMDGRKIRRGGNDGDR